MKLSVLSAILLSASIGLATTLDLPGTLNQCHQLSGLSSGQMASKPSVVTISATWCGPCRVLMPKNETLAQKYGSKMNFVYIMTGGSDLAEAQGEANTYSSMSYFFNDPDTLTKSLGVPYYPYSILLDKSGNEVFAGSADDDFNAYTNEIDALSKAN